MTWQSRWLSIFRHELKANCTHVVLAQLLNTKQSYTTSISEDFPFFPLFSLIPMPFFECWASSLSDTLALLGHLYSTAALHLQSNDPAHLLRMSVCSLSHQKSRTLTQFDLSSLLSTVGVFMYRNIFSVPPWGKRKRPLAAPDLEKLLFSTEFQCALVFLSTPFSFTVCSVCHCILLSVSVYYLMKGYRNFLCSDA